MKFFVRCWLIAMLLLSFPALVEATGCRAVRARIVTPVVVTPVVAAVVTPVVTVAVPVAVPTYNAVYTGSYGYAAGGAGYGSGFGASAGVCNQQGMQSNLSQAVLDAIRELTNEVRALRGGTEAIPSRRTAPPPAPPPMGRADDPPPQANGGSIQRAFAAQQRSCVQCHDANNAASKGGNITLTKGNGFADISPELLGKMIEQVSLKRMPRNGTMSDAERLEFIASHLAK